MPTGELGALLIPAIGEISPNDPFIVPDIAWDGVVDPARAGRVDPAALKICIQNNGDADFINLAWPLDATRRCRSPTTTLGARLRAPAAAARSICEPVKLRLAL